MVWGVYNIDTFQIKRGFYQEFDFYHTNFIDLCGKPDYVSPGIID